MTKKDNARLLKDRETQKKEAIRKKNESKKEKRN